MSTLEIIDSIKWPIVVLVSVSAFVVSVFACLRTINDVAGKFTGQLTVVAAKFAERDTIAIARNRAAAMIHGTLDAADEAGNQAVLSYLFWWPTRRRKSIEGTFLSTSAPPSDESS
jgi:hypothetical protein